jgi:glycogen synthase
MRIAIVSFEYAGAASGGGIGTYVRNAALMLAERGHEVEVFCGHDDTLHSSDENNRGERVRVNLIRSSRQGFSQNAVEPFLARHRSLPFDVVESAEYGADLTLIAKAVPNLARVVKLHTASFQIDEFNDAYISREAKLRFILGAIRRGQWPRRYWGKYDSENDTERAVALAANEVVSPSRALLDWTSRVWQLDQSTSVVVPNAFKPGPELLNWPTERPSKLVTFLGKLEVRKGVLELAKAIPKILEVVRDAQFWFVGRSLPHPATREPLDQVIAGMIGPHAAANVRFRAAVSYEQVADILGKTAIAVFPSYWENFPYVCLEAMAAGCAVVGSSAGGMAEIIEEGRTGLLVPPRDPQAIAAAVIDLMSNPERRMALGAKARESVLERYSFDAIGPFQEASYARAIARAQKRKLNASLEGSLN